MHLQIEEILKATNGEILNEDADSCLKIEINSIKRTASAVSCAFIFFKLFETLFHEVSFSFIRGDII